MIHKAALALAAVVATIALTVALALAGFAPGSAPKTPGNLANLAGDAQAATPSPTVQVDTIYVKPAPTPATIQIVRPAPGGSEHEREGGEGGGDD